MSMENNREDIIRAEPSRPDYEAEIVSLARAGLTPGKLRERLSAYHENDIAAALEPLERTERARLFGVLDAQTLSAVLEYSEHAAQYLSELSMRRRIEALSRLDPAFAADCLSELPKDERAALIELLPGDARRAIELLCSFDEDEIGRCMTTNFISIPAGLGVRQAMKQLIDQAAENDNISTIYVTDADGTLAGAIDLKDLIISREGTALSDITMTSYPYVYASERVDECIERLKDYSEDSIPVLDAENRLRGVLTSQDITQLVDDELGEDYARLAGLSAEEDLREPLRKSIGKRLPWLIVLLGLGLVVSSVVGIFESVVAHLALIVSFQSLILDMAGNVGTQSLAVTIRVLMDERLSARDKLRLVGKEARVGLVNGLILGVMSFLLVGLYLVALKGQPAAGAFSVSLCTGAALVISILLSSVSGTVIPLIFRKLGVDPAVASGPLITTVNDLVAVVTYYGMSWLLLINVFRFAG